jgi:hypothetical protein
MKTRVIQDEPDDDQPDQAVAPRPDEPEPSALPDEQPDQAAEVTS